MPTLKATVNLELDGVSVAGFPVVKRIETEESSTIDFDKTDDGNSTTFTAVSNLASLQAIAITTDQQLTFRFDAQTDQGIVLNAGGLILMMDVTIDASSQTNVVVNNNLQPTANVFYLNVGT